MNTCLSPVTAYLHKTLFDQMCMSYLSRCGLAIYTVANNSLNYVPLTLKICHSTREAFLLNYFFCNLRLTGMLSHVIPR